MQEIGFDRLPENNFIVCQDCRRSSYETTPKVERRNGIRDLAETWATAEKMSL